MSKPTVLIIGTCDTKLAEIKYLSDQVEAQQACQTKILDVSHTSTNDEAYKSLSSSIVAPLLAKSSKLSTLPRGEYVNEAIQHCLPIVQDMVSKGEIHGIVSAAGSTGSSLATALMRKACPIGFPKLMVSTMASGDIKPYIEETDITMMYSVVDIAGLNSILKTILSNAAAAISAMTATYAENLAKSPNEAIGKRIAVTMFGVTTPCADTIRRVLTTTPHDVSAYEIYTFHATGAGGRAMERLIDEGKIDGVIDLTTTEVADELLGGVLTAGPQRLEMAVKKGVPTVVSVGACDMVNFGARDTVPEKYADRNLYEHNPAVTLMRTTKEENAKIGQFIANKLKSHAADPSKIKVLLPEGGVSMIDAPNQPFHDPEADEELFKAIGLGLEDTNVEVERYPEHINDEVFAGQLCRTILELMGINPRRYRLANARRRKWSFDHGASVMAVRRNSKVEIPESLQIPEGKPESNGHAVTGEEVAAVKAA